MPYSVPCPFGAVTSVPADSRSARRGGAAGLRLFGPHRRRELVRREHVELGRDAEHQRPFERVAERVRVRVDQSRQQRPAVAGDGLDAGRQRVADADDDAVAHVHVRARQHAFAVEHPDVADDELSGLLRRRNPCRRRPRRHHAAADECHTNDANATICFIISIPRISVSRKARRLQGALCWVPGCLRCSRCDVRRCKGARVRGCEGASVRRPSHPAPLAPGTSHLALLHPRTSSTRHPGTPNKARFPWFKTFSPMSDPRLVDTRRGPRRARGRRTRRAP